MIALVNDASSSPASKRRPRIWPIILAALLIGHTVLMLVFVTIASHDSSFSIDSDYYGKAIRWDQDQARRRASDALGWNADLQVVDGSAGARAARLTLRDRNGQPIPQAAVDVKFFHHAHGREVRSCSLSADAAGAGQFSNNLLLPYSGEWEFEIVAKADGREFLKTIVMEVP